MGGFQGGGGEGRSGVGGGNGSLAERVVCVLFYYTTFVFGPFFKYVTANV